MNRRSRALVVCLVFAVSGCAIGEEPADEGNIGRISQASCWFWEIPQCSLQTFTGKTGEEMCAIGTTAQLFPTFLETACDQGNDDACEVLDRGADFFLECCPCMSTVDPDDPWQYFPELYECEIDVGDFCPIECQSCSYGEGGPPPV
jgi:hypothetical protein